MKTLGAFLWRDIQNEFSYRLSFVLQILGILPVVLMFHFLSRLFEDTLPGSLVSYGGRYFPFVLIGIAVQNYLSFALGSFSSSMREAQLTGTLEAVLATPVRLPVFLLGSTLYAFFLSSLRIILYLQAGMLLCRAELAWHRLPLILVVLLLSATAFASLGILSAGFVLFFQRGDPLNWLFNVASWLLGGVYYPVSVLPDGLRELARVIPMTHTLEALRILMLNQADEAAVGPHILVLALWVVVGVPFSYGWFRHAFNRARQNGALGHY